MSAKRLARAAVADLPIMGHVWGITNSTESVRLIVSERDNAFSPWSVLYDSGWVNSNRTWTKLEFDDVLSPTSTLVEFKVGALKPLNIGSYNSGSFDDAYLTVVPTPSAVVLGALGLPYAGWKLRRRRAI